MIWRLVIISDGVKDTDGNAKDISHEAKTKAMDLTPKAKTKDIQHKHKSLCHGDLSLWRDVMPESLCLHTRLVTKTHHYRCYVSAGWERTGQYLFIILMSSFPSPPSLPSLPSPFPALLPTPRTYNGLCKNHKNFLLSLKISQGQGPDSQGQDQGHEPRGQGLGLENVFSRTLEAKDMSSRTPSLLIMGY